MMDRKKRFSTKPVKRRGRGGSLRGSKSAQIKDSGGRAYSEIGLKRKRRPVDKNGKARMIMALAEISEHGESYQQKSLQVFS